MRRTLIITLLTLCSVSGIAAQVKDKSNSETFVDSRDKSEYKIVQIGSQVWMAENLRFRPADTQKFWCFGDNEKNCEKYGVLYSWEAAIESCPQGWRMPGSEDWDKLKVSLENDAKQNNQTTDISKMLLAESGFHALYAGFRAESGRYVLLGTHALFWSNEVETTYSEEAQKVGRYFGRHLYIQDKSIVRFEPARAKPDTARSLRCVQN
ncbi:MAG: FISUMP domain-containing protein [Pyrinomonadaceae bacterium]